MDLRGVWSSAAPTQPVEHGSDAGFATDDTEQPRQRPPRRGRRGHAHDPIEQAGEQANSERGGESHGSLAHSSALAAARPISMPASPVSPVNGGAGERTRRTAYIPPTTSPANRDWR